MFFFLPTLFVYSCVALFLCFLSLLVCLLVYSCLALFVYFLSFLAVFVCLFSSCFNLGDYLFTSCLVLFVGLFYFLQSFLFFLRFFVFILSSFVCLFVFCMPTLFVILPAELCVYFVCLFVFFFFVCSFSSCLALSFCSF